MPLLRLTLREDETSAAVAFRVAAPRTVKAVATVMRRVEKKRIVLDEDLG